MALQIKRAIAIEPDITAHAHDAAGSPVGVFRLRDRSDAVWLPRGEYLVRLDFAKAVSGIQRVALIGSCKINGRSHTVVEQTIPVQEASERELTALSTAGAQTEIVGLPGSPHVETLSWRKGAGDWFYRHFDHAARTMGSYMLGDSPLLRGDVLDVGCGDGITDLGFALHYSPRQMIGIDPFRGFDRLPEILRQSGVPQDAVPDSLRFLGHDGSHLPFPDDSFDVVLSWGSLEHIAGGYRQCLREIKRVLRKDGLFFVHPGLFYSNIGHHLGEFSNEPFFHLTMDEAALKEMVLSGTPEYIDRSGLQATPAEYWQWYKELNPITVAGFEQELRAMDFEPWRVAIRTVDRFEYTPELLAHSMQDLATNELYVSCWNRKLQRPESYRQRAPDGFDSELGR